MIVTTFGMYTNWLETIASNKDLTGSDFRVLLTLLANAEGLKAEIRQAQIAQKLDLKASHVSRAISNLCNKGIIEKKTVAGKVVGYRLAVTEDSKV